MLKNKRYVRGLVQLGFPKYCSEQQGWVSGQANQKLVGDICGWDMARALGWFIMLAVTVVATMLISMNGFASVTALISCQSRVDVLSHNCNKITNNNNNFA